MKESEIRNSQVHDKYLDLVRQDAESLLRHKDLFTQSNCPVCLSEDLVDEFTKFGFGYQTCGSCRTLFVNPRPSLELLEDFYAHSESSRFWVTDFFLPMVEARRTKIFHPRAQQIVNLLSLRQGARVGDVGAGYGIFLEELRTLRPDLNLVSIEPSPEMAEICRSKELQVLEGVIENVRGFDGEFDLLCSFELFEHLHSPVEMVNAVFRLLRPGGVFYMTTLNGLGFDVLSVANNHSNDYGPEGMSDTMVSLAQAGVVATGLAGEFALGQWAGRRVAVLAFSPYGRHNNLTQLTQAAALVRKAKQQADLVVVTFHGGAEGDAGAVLSGAAEMYVGEDRGDPRAFAQAVVAAGADLVLGHGPHVLRPLECVQGKLVAYSLGNFVSAGGLSVRNLANVSALLEVALHPQTGDMQALRLWPATFNARRLPVPDPSGRAVWLVNWLGSQSGQQAVGWRPLWLPGFEARAPNFARWLATTQLARCVQASTPAAECPR